jgi:membrane-bound lytic murein transglycosylase D
MPDLESDLVKKWEQWYATRPDYVQRMTERGGRYLFHVVEEVHKRGLPMELALLPFIESAFNPQALSVASASGMWQFMPATGLQYELKQNLFRDDRRDVLASTRAALDYLQMLHRMFDDWHLALAAYNWGQGNVQRALERNRRARQDLVYTALRMPDETRNYVPKLQAVKNILLSPATFGLTLPKLENHPFFLTVNIDRDMDAELVARLAGLSMDEFQALNPQLNKPVLLAAGTPQVLLPYDSANRFVGALARHTGPWASWTAWVAPRTLRPAEAAKLVGFSEARLRELNKIPERMVIKAGSTLIVPRPHHHTQDVTEQLADQARIQLAPDGPRMVRRTVKAHAKGESLAAFARRHGHSVTDLAQWNKLSAQAMLRPGQALTVMSFVQASAGQPKRAKGAAPATARKERAGARSSPKPGPATRARDATPR